MKKELFTSLVLLSLGTLAIIGCTKEPKMAKESKMTIANSSITLVHDGESKIDVINAKNTPTFESDNEFIATVSKEGIVTGGVRGQTTIKVTSGGESATCNITIRTLINFIPEPYLGFGDTYSQVKRELEKNGEKVEESENGVLAQIRKIDGTNFLYMYTFENDSLKTAAFALSLFSKPVSVIPDFLMERYVVVSRVEPYSVALISPDLEMGVLLRFSENPDVMIVVYTPSKAEPRLKGLELPAEITDLARRVML